MADFLRRAPFDLDDRGVEWVEQTLAAMGPRARGNCSCICRGGSIRRNCPGWRH